MGAKGKIKKYQETEELTQTDTPGPPSKKADTKGGTHQGDDDGDASGAGEAVDEAEVESDMAQQLASAEQAAQDTQDRFLRLAAEFDNFKKRTAREKEDLRKFATEALLRELLPVVDNLERAIQSSDGSDQTQGVVAGVQLTLDELMKVLERFKVTQLASVDQPFDPTYHQAVAQKASESHPDNTVIEEFQKGYTLHGRLLRPAMVVVSKAQAPSDGQSD
jgi:molecular chaperone GrpE